MTAPTTTSPTRACATCVFWQRFLEQQGGKTAPAAMGECARIPRWEDTHEAHFCYEWRSA